MDPAIRVGLTVFGIRDLDGLPYVSYPRIIRTAVRSTHSMPSQARLWAQWQTQWATSSRSINCGLSILAMEYRTQTTDPQTSCSSRRVLTTISTGGSAPSCSSRTVDSKTCLCGLKLEEFYEVWALMVALQSGLRISVRHRGSPPRGLKKRLSARLN